MHWQVDKTTAISTRIEQYCYRDKGLFLFIRKRANFVAMRIPRHEVMRANLMMEKQHMPSSKRVQQNDGILTATSVITLSNLITWSLLTFLWQKKSIQMLLRFINWKIFKPLTKYVLVCCSITASQCFFSFNFHIN